MATPKAPPGGFKEGGWYEGRQYIGGTFSQPGQIHPSSPQVGAGQAVSKEVIAQTSPANVQYITEQRAAVGLPPPPSVSQPSPPTPTSADQVTPYLNAYQQDLLKTSQAPEVRIPTMEELKTELAPTTGLPAPISRVQERERLRTEFGVADLEKSLTTIKDQITAEQDLLREQRGIEEGKPVPMGVIAGRISEEERVANVRLDALGRQQSRIVDELNTKYNIIGQYVQDLGLDYGDAVKRYETEFDMNLKMYDLIAGERKEARSAYEYDQTAARANLQIYTNAAIAGNIDYNSLGADQKLMISKLEVQSGLPVGFISSIKKDPKADIIFTSSNEGVTQVGFRNADGSISVKSYGTKITTPSEARTTNKQQQKQEVATWFTQANAEEAQQDAKTLIQKGYDPEIVYDELKRAFPDVTPTTKVTNANINKAKQLIMQNDGTDEDLKKAETDQDFVNWVIANY